MQTRVRGVLLVAATAATTAVTLEARAQGSIALDQYQPPLAGDTFLAVPSPQIGGHLVPRGALTLDYAHEPLRLVDENGDEVATPVTSQTFLHVGGSLALWDRLMLGVDMPFAVAQSGDDPTVGGTIGAADGAQAGDLRLALRGRLIGEYFDPFQLSVGGYVWLPTGEDGSYTSEGSAYGQPELLLGGRASYFVWAASGGATIRGSDNPHTFVYRAALGLEFLDHRIHIGPEIFGSANLDDQPLFGTIERESSTNGEWLFGGKVHIVSGLALGAGAGTGFTEAVGTPAFRVLGRLEWNPIPEKDKPVSDRDGDGILDPVDACIDVPGEPNDDPAKHGCPPDRDGDGILDKDDACPDKPGPANDDPKKHGCPLPGDKDGDGITDDVDACPDVKGVPNDDPKKHGCPDRDGDGIVDAEDACPDVAGVADPDPKKNGCPPDRDGDKILDVDDACPDQPGVADPDPKKHGCPRVIVTDTEIKILQKIEFEFDKATILPVSDPIIDDVAQVMKDHPEIELLEVQGHTDSKGGAPYNKALSQRRAESVQKALEARGVEAKRLRAKGYGLEKPIGSNDTDEGRAQNRRVEFQIVTKTEKATP